MISLYTIYFLKQNKKVKKPELIENKKHYVTKVSNTKLTSLLPESFLVNSYHHQSVKDLPDGFITTFVNQDVIEAIEHQTLPLIGIQWHPERFYTNESKIIFDYLISTPFVTVVTDSLLPSFAA